MTKAEVAFMNGGRIDGYYYICLKGTDLIACQDGHPDSVLRFKERTKDAEKNAAKACREINKQLKKVTDE